MGYPRKFRLPPIALERRSTEPLHRQLYGCIAQAIRGGQIENGARLPSSRIMAKLLGVSRNTVLSAYEALAADELILGKHGAGMRVIGGDCGADGTTGIRPAGVRRILRQARFPGRTIPVTDPDGNAIYFNF